MFFVFSLFLPADNVKASTESYIVVFQEDYYKEKGLLYRARVTVIKNNRAIRTPVEMRGSSLPNRFLYYTDQNRPIIAPGEYPFDVKIHARFGKALCLNGGGYMETINPNPIHHNNFKANGIWVHQGNKGPVKGSEGCLTIDPLNWDDFVSLFPDAAEWEKLGCRGKICINRNGRGPIVPQPPSNFHIRNKPSH